MLFCREVYNQLYVLIVVFCLVTPRVNDWLMFGNTLLPLPSGFTSTLKMEAAVSSETLIASHVCTISHPKDHNEFFMAIKFLNLNSLMFDLLLKNISLGGSYPR